MREVCAVLMRSSTTAATLEDIEKTLRSIEARLPRANEGVGKSPMTIMSPVQALARPVEASAQPQQATPSLPSAPILRQRHGNVPSSVDEYLRSRRMGDEYKDLLPLKESKPAPKPEISVRDQLLDGAGTRPGMGAAQLHEELGGQLADVSQLRTSGPADIDVAPAQAQRHALFVVDRAGKGAA